ncbi:hypothetical protein ACFFF5_07245 [Lederbergia wuyishanensis]|uniref:Uncharacterized protein n=1 Tax=Lederbergia wuyishanensis TaxID=1347903 RepID=A0ABU0D2C2_9BACI|nr:hypothetical protein [Lederbergia wuyishanensis]MCJ8007285.1 hypothetical protein [Lederbergia wuyishanensis]MDQ0342560.1 hypothetical protein [Lederbergia wuyishanensis]
MDFVREIRLLGADELYHKQDYRSIERIEEYFSSQGVEFQLNLDGPFILLAFCYELKHRLGWQDEQLYRHFRRNSAKLRGSKHR